MHFQNEVQMKRFSLYESFAHLYFMARKSKEEKKKRKTSDE
jgi:hypothetical protein